MNPIQALKMLDSVDNSEPQKKQAAINTVAREAPKWVIAVAKSSKARAEAQQKEIDTLKALLVAVIKATGVDLSTAGLNPSAAVQDPNGFVEVPNGQAQAEPVAAAPPSAPTQRVYQDGTPMSPEDAAKEDLMDAAIVAGSDGSSQPAGRTPFNGA